ncbi:MAG TPA: V-type ATPase subunit [Kofleriaceae bacterium]
MSALVTRARGLQAHLLDEPELDPKLSPEAVERELRRRLATDFKILARWASRDQLAVLELDEDRHSLRAIVRGLAAGVPSERRRIAAVATSRLTERVLDELAAATSIDAIARELAAIDHPLHDAFETDTTSIDVFAIELALAKSYARAARAHAHDRALATYLAQVIDAENATSARLLVARGGNIVPAEHFIPGGERLSLAAFTAITRDNIRDVLAEAFADTPLARNVDEDTVLAWQLATQRKLRRSDPLGLAAVVYAVLSRRFEIRRLRRAAWRSALGGTR